MEENKKYDNLDEEIVQLVEKIKKYAPSADFDMVIKAYYFAKDAHEGVTRKSGEPYIIHPVAVANILADMQMDVETISAGLLHDVVEDTDYTLEDMVREFNEEVAVLVDGVTKLGKIKYQSKIESQAENLKKMFLAMFKDRRVIIIKLADRLHNMRTLEYMDEEKAKYKAKETIEIYGGIAGRLGISKIKWELEDIALRYLDPEGYEDLVQKVNKKRSQREEYIDKVIDILKTSFDEMDIESEVKGRPKHFYSIYRKMKKKHKNFEEIYDLTAIRIIVNSVKDCYAVLGVVHTFWKPIPGRFKDYIAMPKPNLYQSLHTTVVGPDGEPVEIQIRTHEMHLIAEYGFAAHWKYKEGIRTKELSVEDNLQWLRQVMEWSDEVQDPQEFMDSLRDDAFNSQVYVFTPQSDVIEMAAGATPIDFAYRIHTNVGHKCVGAKVNGRIVPLETPLRNGNIVEIITNSNSPGPSRDWLNIVKTPNARNRIRQFFKKERRDENLERGQAILDREYKRLELPKNEPLIDKCLQTVAKKYNQPSVDDLIATIGYGGIQGSHVGNKIKDLYTQDVKKAYRESLAGKEEDIEEVQQKSQEYANKKANKKRKQDKGVTVEGLDNILIRFAKCCNPLPGDDIIGYITKGRGVAIHRKDCINIDENDPKNKGRLISVSWDHSEASKFDVEIKVKAIDRKGIINEITHIVANEKVQLNGIYARKGKEVGVMIDLLLEVNGKEDLANVMNKLKNIPGVDAVFRTNS